MTSRPQPTSEALFAAARRDRPPAEVKQRVLTGMLELSRERPARVGAVPIVAPILLAAAAIVALWLLNVPARMPSSIVAEPIPTLSSSRPSPPATISAHPPPVVTSAPPPATRQPPRRRPPPSLSQEVESLERVQAALDGRDPEQALQLLDVYRRSGGSRLQAEAQLLRIEALSRSGKTEEASRLARVFVANHPGNPLIDRARAFVGSNPE